MCKAFSCIVDRYGKVTWKLGVDSHSELARLGGYPDRVLGEFAKIEIIPRNNNYLKPDEWVYQVDESPVPAWCGFREKELALAAHKVWLSQLRSFLKPHPIVHPSKVDFAGLTLQHIRLLKKWDSVRASVWASVGASVWDSVGDSVRASVGNSVRASVGNSVRASVGASVGNSVRASVGNSVRASVGASVWDSVGAYAGSFFRIPKWKDIKHPAGRYPFQSPVTLWNQGLIPSFDGTTWRLHAGPKAAIVFSITQEELRKANPCKLTLPKKS